MKKVFYEKRCSCKLHKIRRKIPVPESFFNKIAGLRAATLLKKETLAQVLSCEFCEMSTNTLFQNTSGRLLLILFVACFYIFHIRHEKVSSCEKSRLVENRLYSAMNSVSSNKWALYKHHINTISLKGTLMQI